MPGLEMVTVALGQERTSVALASPFVKRCRHDVINGDASVRLFFVSQLPDYDGLSSCSCLTRY